MKTTPYRTNLRALIAFLCLLALPASRNGFSQNTIALTGLASDHEGAAAWNANGSGPEPARTGHYVALASGNAYYYLASRDFGGIDTASSSAAFHGVTPVTGFSHFTAAMTGNGFSIGQLKMKNSILTLGDDIEGVDWFISGFVETRYYTGGTYTIYLNGEPLLTGDNPRTTLIINYQTAAISMTTDYAIPTNASGASSAGVQAVAAALLEDIGNYGIRFVYNTISQSNSFSGTGRNGSYFQILSGVIDRGVSQIGLTDDETTVPVRAILRQNYPNPFNPVTSIRYFLPMYSQVKLEIFNIVGQKVTTLFNGDQNTGEYTITWNGADQAGKTVSSGVYIYRLTAGHEVISKKLIFLR